MDTLKLNRIGIFLFLILLGASLQAQQGVQWTQYVMNKYAINPAYAGLDKSLSITGGIRSQWSKFEGSPKTQILNAHLPMYFLNGSVGFSLENDQAGPLRRTSGAVSYNYVYDGSFGLISFGGRIGIQQVGLNTDALITPDGIYQDQTIDHQDPRITVANPVGITPIWSLGGYYILDMLEVGLAFDHFPNTGSEAGATTFNNESQISLFASYQIPVGEILSVEPNFFVKTDGAQTQVDLGVIGYYETVFAGASIRGLNGNSLDALGMLVGTRLSKNVRISYSFDLGLSGLSDFHSGTHEFLFNYNLAKPIRTGELPKIIYNPRYR